MYQFASFVFLLGFLFLLAVFFFIQVFFNVAHGVEEGTWSPCQCVCVVQCVCYKSQSARNDIVCMSLAAVDSTRLG